MPGLVTTRPKNDPKNKSTARFLLFLRSAIWAGAAVALLAQPSAGHAEWKPSQLQSGTAPSKLALSEAEGSPESQPSASPAPQSQSGAAPASPAGSSQQQAPDENGTYVIRKDVDEVLLHATVVDDKQHIVTNLDRNAFTIFEDGKPQNIISFHNEDIPVSIGIVIDNSGSMREKRAKVNQAALNLVRSSNPQDEVFVVNFNDEYYLDQDFTNDLLKLKEALEKIDARGGTALRDALVASAEHLKRDARLERRVLFVVTDGDDNASRDSLEDAVKQLQAENGPSVYAIGILGDEEHPKRARRALEIIAQRTGGLAFFPSTLDQVDEISRQVAHDIRNQYTIGYRPTKPRASGGFRTIRVEAKKGRGKLVVRTKSGYYAGTQPAASGTK
jgi:Ca-activated chloride channel family protein